MEALPNLPWGTVGPWAIVAMTVYSIIRGLLIPRGTWTEWQRIHNDRLAEAKSENETLHETVRLQHATIEQNTEHLKQLLEFAKLNDAMLTSLRKQRGP